MQFLAFRRGLSPLTGSVLTTSSPAAYTFPLFNASARSFFHNQLSTGVINDDNSIFHPAILSLLIMPSVDGNNGQ